MMNEDCPKKETCPLFIGDILVSEVAEQIYKDLYCTNGEKGRNRCMRFRLSQVFKGPVSVEVMPNDKRDFDELVKKYKPKH